MFYLYYWKFFTTIDSEGDVIETPNGRIYKLYFHYMYWQKRARVNADYQRVADRHLQRYELEKSKYKGIDRRDKGTARSFRPLTTSTKRYTR